MHASDMPTTAALSTDSSTQLHGRWLWVARAIWGLVVVLVMIMFGLGIPRRVEDMGTRCILEPCQNLHLSTGGAQALEATLGLTPLTYGILVAAMESYLTLAFFVSGVVIACRRSDDWMALFSSVVLILAGIGQSAFLSLLALAMPIFSVPVRLIGSLAHALIILLFYLFPDGRMRPGWVRWPAFIFTGMGAFIAFNDGLFTPSGLPFLAIVLAGGVLSQVYRYRTV